MDRFIEAFFQLLLKPPRGLFVDWIGHDDPVRCDEKNPKVEIVLVAVKIGGDFLVRTLWGFSGGTCGVRIAATCRGKAQRNH